MQAERAHAADGGRARRDHRRGRLPTRRVQSRPRLRAGGGAGAPRARRRGRDQLHGGHLDRAHRRADGGRAVQEAVARARRQEPHARVRRLRGGRPGLRVDHRRRGAVGVPQPGTDLSLRFAHPRRAIDLRQDRRRNRRARRVDEARRSRRVGHGARCARVRRAPTEGRGLHRARARGGRPHPNRGRAAGAEGTVRRRVLPAAHRDHRPRADVPHRAGRDLRTGRHGPPVRRRSGGDRRSRTAFGTGSRLRCGPAISDARTA